MESGVAQENNKSPPGTQDVVNSDSIDNFQKCIYELFEKNGILNDLRAYLRGHIINVLRTARAGDTPPCQKRFTQRLELTFQALNILIAEYLFRLDFNYSLSVFVSEIPLANMVFDFAKTLMEKNESDVSEIRFTEKDVWSILNYLGVQCDSDHASYIIEMYRTDRQISLLLCILKCLPMYDKELKVDQATTSDDTLSSAKSTDALVSKDCQSVPQEPTERDKCDHLAYCKTCRHRIMRLKSKVKKKNKYFSKNLNYSIKSLRDEKLMKNIGIMERTIIDEMFQQLQSVYEAEVSLVKEEEEKKVKRSMASHALQLQKQRDELEEAYKARSAQLEASVLQKKQFLWGLARALRDQHRHLARAMHDVRQETHRLAAKEDSLKTQLAEAEQILKKRSEEMRSQISDELNILEGHLSSMKQERELINKERSELENLKTIENNNNKLNKPHNLISEELHSHYDLLKNELAILKKYLESSKMTPKCVIERGTITEHCDEGMSKVKVGLNNSQVTEKSRNDDVDGRLKSSQVVNDFKKKNVNFGPSKLDEIYRERSYSLSSASSEAGDTPHAADLCDKDMLHRLRQENNRLKACARQQKCHIDVLSRACARAGRAPPAAATAAAAAVAPGAVAAGAVVPGAVAAGAVVPGAVAAGAVAAGAVVPGAVAAGAAAAAPAAAAPAQVATFPVPLAPATAPAAIPANAPFQPQYFLHSVNTSASANTISVGWRKGAGEELSMFTDAQPRILVPGDSIPFVGVLKDRDRHGITRSCRQLMSQWRSLRARGPPRAAGVSKRAPSPINERPGSSSGHTVVISSQQENDQASHSMREKTQHRVKSIPSEANRNREKSPKSVLREAKEKLRNIKESSIAARPSSPGAVLREAKLRLRKLEIEAEAVEQSYIDFRRRQSQLRLQRRTLALAAARPACPALREPDLGDSLDIKQNHSHQKLEDKNRNAIDIPLTEYQKSIRNDFDKYLREYKTKLDLGEAHFRNRSTAESNKSISKVYPKLDDEDLEVHDDFLETPLTEFRKLYHPGTEVAQGDSPRSFIKPESYNSELSEQGSLECDDSASASPQSPRRGILRPGKCSKPAELEILKKNINKMYNLSKEPEHDETSIVERDVSKTEEQNLLRIEVESVNDVKAEAQDLLLVVKNTIDVPEVLISPSSHPENLSGQMTIIMSPRESHVKEGEAIDFDVGIDPPERSKRSSSPEQEAHLTRNDVLDAIFQADAHNQKSSTQMHSEVSKDNLAESVSEYENRVDYPDDFSADVDNYNSHTESANSPISLLKTSEDENYWDM